MAIVFIHYAFLHAYEYFDLEKLPFLLYLCLLPFWLALCVYLSNLAQAFSGKLFADGNRMAIICSLLIVVIAFLLKVVFPIAPLNFVMTFIAGMLLCLMLVLDFNKIKSSF